MENLLYIQDPSFSLENITYFTSPIKPDLARRGICSDEAQKTYLRALKTSNINIIMGRHKLEKAKAPIFVEGQKADRNNPFHHRLPFLMLLIITLLVFSYYIRL